MEDDGVVVKDNGDGTNTIIITDTDLLEKLEEAVEMTGLTAEEVLNEALRNFVSGD